jgi:hypothetical protein
MRCWIRLVWVGIRLRLVGWMNICSRRPEFFSLFGRAFVPLPEYFLGLLDMFGASSVFVLLRLLTVLQTKII